MSATRTEPSELLLDARRNLRLEVAAEGVTLSVRSFQVREAVSELFEVSVVAVSPQADLELGAIVGRPASLRVVAGELGRAGGTGRTWSGVCCHVEQLRAEPDGLSTYAFRIAPELWLLGLRRDHRIFQHLSVPEILERVLAPWRIAPVWALDRAAFPKLHYKVQYGESDLAFLFRLGEEAGIAITFTDDEAGARPVFHDALGTGERREAAPIRDVGPTEAWGSGEEQASKLRIAHQVRPGAYVLRDVDLRRPRARVLGAARDAREPEARLEQYHYVPGAFSVDVPGADTGATPVADDRGATRHDDPTGRALAERFLASLRGDARVVSFETNVHALAPGVVFALDTYPRAELEGDPSLLVIASTLGGPHDGAWSHEVKVVLAGAPFRPARRTPKPRLVGVQSAVVVGPEGEEIHTDELGRVRVQFPWDREGKLDEHSSCWIRVSQGWAGAAHGMAMIPRVGQEVLVAFANGDPDEPLVVGRMYNATAPVPQRLPANATVSAWRSDSSPGSDGYNEIRYDDAKGEELVYVQAEKNLRRLVKHDETLTVGRDLEQLVEGCSADTTHGDRTEVTRERRKATTYGASEIDLRANEQKRVEGVELEESRSDRQLYVRGEVDTVVHRRRRERIGADAHTTVSGGRREQVRGSQSLTVVDEHQIEVSGTYALEAGATLRFAAGEGLVGEAVDLTLKGPGGFVRIDAGGVTIGGTLVKINEDGRAITGRPVRPRAPERAEVPPVLEPEEGER